MLALKGGAPVRTKPFPTWPVVDQSDEEAVARAVRDGVWGLGGKSIAEFEAKFSAFQDAKYGITATSGTTSLQLSLTALGVGPGDEVIIPPYTFTATASAVLQVGAIPVFADVDDTLCIDPKAVEAAITPRTACIIPVHVAGCPCDLDALVAISKRHGIPLLEDAAQAHGARWNGRGVGSYGDLGTFSFQSSKNLACGEGGIIITNSELLADMIHAYHNCGRWEGPTGPRPVLGWNLRMTELQASLLCSQMRRLDSQANMRDANGKYLSSRLNNMPGIIPVRRDPRVTRHAYHLYMFRINTEEWGISLDTFIQALNAEGIPCSRGYYPLYRASGFVTWGQSCPAAWEGLANQLAGKDYRQIYLPVVEAASESTVWLYQSMLLGDQSDMDDIATAIEKVWAARVDLQKGGITGESVGYAGL